MPAPEVECRICKHQRGASCWTLIGLLFIDLLTLALLIGGYNKLKQFHEGGAIVIAMAKDDDILFLENYIAFPPTAGRNGGYLPRDQDIPSSFQGMFFGMFGILNTLLTNCRQES